MSKSGNKFQLKQKIRWGAIIRSQMCSSVHVTGGHNTSRHVSYSGHDFVLAAFCVLFALK